MTKKKTAPQPSLQVELADALQLLIDRAAHMPIFGGDPSVMNVRKAAKYIEAVEYSRALIAKAKGGKS